MLKAKELKEGAIVEAAADAINNNNNDYSSKKVHGYDAIGRPLADIEERDRKLIENAKNKTETVQKIIEVANRTDTVEFKEFCVIHANIFVKTPENNQIVPAEVAVTKFSIEKGIVETYHTFIKPGDIPRGYKYMCMETSETKHKIPLYPDENTDPNSTMRPQITPYPADRDIIENIKKMLGSSEYLFTMPDCDDICSGVLKTLADRARVYDIDVCILPLPELLFNLAGLKPLNDESLAVPTINMAQAQFEKERFLYHHGLSCAWHESETDTSNCSQGFVLRWIYTILAYTNEIFDVHVDLEDGKHVPLGLLQDEINEDIKWDNEK